MRAQKHVRVLPDLTHQILDAEDGRAIRVEPHLLRSRVVGSVPRRAGTVEIVRLAPRVKPLVLPLTEVLPLEQMRQALVPEGAVRSRVLEADEGDGALGPPGLRLAVGAEVALQPPPAVRGHILALLQIVMIFLVRS